MPLFDTQEQVTLRGTITRIVYNENGRVIAKIQLAPESLNDGHGKRRPPVWSVLGSMADPLLGQLYEFSGREEYDDKYKAHQIKLDSYRTILPEDRDGIASYLIDTAKWVGPTTAKAILDALGTDTLTVLRTDPDRVATLNIPGLTPERITEMSQSLKDNEAVEAATVEVNNLIGGVLGPATTRKAIKKWKSDAATLIRRNPYILEDLHGVGFISADAVAKKIGFAGNAIERHMAAVGHILKTAAGGEGHTVVSLSRLTAEGAKLIGGLRPDAVACAVESMEVETVADSAALADLAEAEQYIASKLSSMMKLEGVYTDASQGSTRLFPPVDVEGLADDQAEAVRAFEFARVFCLVGAPGTGKTYTVARIVRALQRAGLRVALAAPTGKGAKQMALALAGSSMATPTTVHTLLEPTVDEETGAFDFGRDEHNPLEVDVLVVDEFSMVDVPLGYSLLRALPETSRLLIVGDHYQLPSVGPGAVLRDLLAAGVPHYELTAIKRNAGLIVRQCHAMKDGRTLPPAAALDLANGDNWRHIEVAGDDAIKRVIDTLIREKLPAAGIDRQWGWQLISPTNEKGALSCDALNDLAGAIVNPAGERIERLDFCIGDKVVRCKNGEAAGESGTPDNVDMRNLKEEPIRVVNGDLGHVLAAEARHVVVHFRFPDRVVRIKRSDHHLKRAYCLTCHKMQGSEVPVVILPLSPGFARMPLMTREWIYTAFSRAKSFIVTVGDLDALIPAIRRVGMNARRTTLVRRMAALRDSDLDEPPSLIDELLADIETREPAACAE